VEKRFEDIIDGRGLGCPVGEVTIGVRTERGEGMGDGLEATAVSPERRAM